MWRLESGLVREGRKEGTNIDPIRRLRRTESHGALKVSECVQCTPKNHFGSDFGVTMGRREGARGLRVRRRVDDGAVGGRRQGGRHNITKASEASGADDSDRGDRRGDRSPSAKRPAERARCGQLSWPSRTDTKRARPKSQLLWKELQNSR